jgi:uncharacterized protein YdeI (YjbR/CyaY-like superfamily)
MSAGAFPEVAAASLADWRAWLAANHASSGTVWLVTWKAGRGPYLTYGDARDEALCWGWIDSQARRVDADRTATRMSPRRPGSPWSRINRDRIAALTAAGRMQPPGIAAVEAACADGSWDALAVADDPDRVPADLAAVLGPHVEAWLALPRSLRRARLERIALARTSAGRERQLAAAVAEARTPPGGAKPPPFATSP